MAGSLVEARPRGEWFNLGFYWTQDLWPALSSSMWVSSWSTGTFGLDLSCPDGWHGFSESLSCYKWAHHDHEDNDNDHDHDDVDDNDNGGDHDDHGKCRFLDDYQQTWEAGQEHCRDWGAGWFELHFTLGESVKVKVWKWNCESVKVKLWKCESESVKVWQCEIESVKVWKWKWDWDFAFAWKWISPPSLNSTVPW